MKKIILLVIMLYMIPFVNGQSAIGQQEDFEDDTVGSNPTATWYSFTESAGGQGACVGCGQANRNGVIASGWDGTTQRHSFLSDDGTGGAFARWTITEPQAFDNLTFYLGISEHSPTARSVNCQFRFYDGSQSQFLRIQLTRSQATPTDGRAFLPDNGATNLFTTSGYTDGHFIRMTFNYDANTLNFNVDGSDITTIAFTASNLGGWSFTRSLGNACFADIDQIKLNGGPITEVEILEPAEFDTGLINTIHGLGFKSINSEMLFSLILIAFMTVMSAMMLKFMGKGSGKIWIIHGAAALMGVFCVLLGILKLWMFVVAIVIGSLLAKGGREFIDTFKSLATPTRRRPMNRAAAVAHGTRQLTRDQITFNTVNITPALQGESEPEPEEDTERILAEQEGTGLEQAGDVSSESEIREIDEIVPEESESESETQSQGDDE